MGIFDFFKPKKPQLTEEDRKWNKMWALWSDGAADSPYSELMTYQSEVNNGGHDQYFTNMESTCDLKKELLALDRVLTPKLSENLKKAYAAYRLLEENEEEQQAATVLSGCDDMFFEYEEDIVRALNKYADSIRW